MADLPRRIFIQFPALFEDDDEGTDLLRNLGVKASGDATEEGVVLIAADEIVSVSSNGEPLGSETTIHLRNGLVWVVNVATKDVVALLAGSA